MLRLKVRISQLSTELRIDPRHGEADPRQHIIRRNPVDMVLVDLCANHDTLVVVIVPAPALARPSMFYRLCPPRGLLVLQIVEVEVRLGRAGDAARHAERGPSQAGGRRRRETVRGEAVRGESIAGESVLGGVGGVRLAASAARRELGDLQGRAGGDVGRRGRRRWFVK